MNQSSLKDRVALVAAIALPFWNLPLILHMIERRSSQDISIAWCVGVFVCILLMAPQGLASPDKVWRWFNIINFFWFTGVVATVFYYRM